MADGDMPSLTVPASHDLAIVQLRIILIYTDDHTKWNAFCVSLFTSGPPLSASAGIASVAAPAPQNPRSMR